MFQVCFIMFPNRLIIMIIGYPLGVPSWDFWQVDCPSHLREREGLGLESFRSSSVICQLPRWGCLEMSFFPWHTLIFWQYNWKPWIFKEAS
jgi:hypothetical protein